MKIFKKIFDIIVKFLYIASGFLRDDAGNISSVRIVLIWAAFRVDSLIRWWQHLIITEISKDEPNVEILKDVLKDLIYPVIAILIGAIIGKIIQKKLEPKANTNDSKSNII